VLRVLCGGKGRLDSGDCRKGPIVTTSRPTLSSPGPDWSNSRNHEYRIFLLRGYLWLNPNNAWSYKVRFLIINFRIFHKTLDLINRIASFTANGIMRTRRHFKSRNQMPDCHSICPMIGSLVGWVEPVVSSPRDED
jgi:hypothetical protein